MRILLASALAIAITAGWAYSIVQSVANPGARGTYPAYTTSVYPPVFGSGIDWTDRANAGFAE